MTAINNLSEASPLALSDNIPVYSAANGDTRRASLTSLVALLNTALSISDKYVTQYEAPAATGFTVTLPASSQSTHLVLTPVAGYAAGTIVLAPSSSAVDKQEVLCVCTQAVTTLTITSAGATLIGAPTTLAANAFFRLRYDPVLKRWYRVG